MSAIWNWIRYDIMKCVEVYLVFEVHGSMTWTTIKACRKWLAIMSGLKGVCSS